MFASNGTKSNSCNFLEANNLTVKTLQYYTVVKRMLGSEIEASRGIQNDADYQKSLGTKLWSQ